MLESVSHYVMPGESETETAELIHSLGLDGIENLIYGTTPSPSPFTRLTVGAHLKFWPTWMDFYSGNQKRVQKQYPDKQSLIACYGADTPEKWIEEIKKNIRAALAEEPYYLVWHVADCLVEETWTRKFHYTSKEVLTCTAEIYKEVYKEIPENVEILFENIFWPGLCTLSPEETDYFFSLLPGNNTGIVLDTGHYMNTNPDLETEDDGADYIIRMIHRLGSMKSLIRGMHLSCSLSGAYRKSCPATPPENLDGNTIMKHITSIDRHNPFRTSAAARIVEAAEPEFLTHELFGPKGEIPIDQVKTQKRAIEKISKGK